MPLRDALLAATLALAATAPTRADHSSHAHGSLAVDRAKAPTVALSVAADSMTGWNVHVTTKRFKFAPEHVGEKHVASEGHAHLYLDGKKIARLYGPWFHLAAPAPGRHELRVTLNANSHEELAVDGKTVEATAQFEQPAP